MFEHFLNTSSESSSTLLLFRRNINGVSRCCHVIIAVRGHTGTTMLLTLKSSDHCQVSGIEHDTLKCCYFWVERRQTTACCRNLIISMMIAEFARGFSMILESKASLLACRWASPQCMLTSTRMGAPIQSYKTLIWQNLTNPSPISCQDFQMASLASSFHTPLHTRCSSPPPLAIKSSFVGRASALAPHRLAPQWQHP